MCVCVCVCVCAFAYITEWDGLWMPVGCECQVATYVRERGLDGREYITKKLRSQTCLPILTTFQPHLLLSVQ